MLICVLVLYYSEVVAVGIWAGSFPMDGLEVESEGYVLVYDLPSENRIDLNDKRAREKVKNLRIRATRRLHSLGLTCTQSVILLGKKRVEDAKKAVREIEKEYQGMARELQIPRFYPIIRIIMVRGTQYDSFKEIAEHALKERLDELIDRVSGLIAEIDQIEEEARLRKVEAGIKRGIRELERIEEMARELGISTNHKLDLLSSLYKKALEKIRGEVQ